jgi:tetratricopeptide (TPR) repeat protein
VIFSYSTFTWAVSSQIINLKVLLHLVCGLFVICGSVSPPSSDQGTSHNEASSSDALSRRLEAAMEARNSGNPVLIGQASQQVIALALVEMARFRLDERAYGEAIKLCEQSLEFEDTAETRIEIAIASLYAKKPSEAASMASSAVALDPGNPLGWTIKGEALLQSQDFGQAATAFSKAVQVKRDAEPVYGLALAELGMGEKQRAAEILSQFLSIVGDFGWSRVLAGRAYQQNGLWQEAEMEFQKALLLDPATPNAHYFWAITLMQGNGWIASPEVASQLRAELQLNTRHFEANYMLGYLASTAGNYKESDQYLHLASEVKPSVPETWVLLGLNAQNRKANQATEAYFRKAITLAESLGIDEHLEVRKAYIGLGRLLMASARTQEGERLLNKARELQAQVLAENQRMFAAMKGPGEEKVVGAVAPYIPDADFDQRPSFSPPSSNRPTTREDSSSTRFATRSPRSPEGKTEKHLEAVLGSSFNDLATAEALQGKYDQALKHYREAANFDSRIPGLQRNLGLAAFFAGQPTEAVQLLSRVLARTPDDTHARAVLGMAYCATENFTKAVQTITPIANLALQDAQLGFAWAKSLAQTGNKQGAARALHGMDKAHVNLSVEQLVQFGQLWQELGDADRAVQAFRRALQLDPENSDARCGLHLAKCP